MLLVRRDEIFCMEFIILERLETEGIYFSLKGE